MLATALTFGKKLIKLVAKANSKARRQNGKKTMPNNLQINQLAAPLWLNQLYANEWQSIIGYFGYTADLDSGNNDLLNWVLVLSVLQQILKQVTYPTRQTALLSSGTISGSGTIIPGGNSALCTIEFQGQPPPLLNTLFGSPNLRNYGQFAWLLDVPGVSQPALSELSFLNGPANYRESEPNLLNTGFYYNLQPGVKAYYQLFESALDAETGEYSTVVTPLGFFNEIAGLAIPVSPG